MRDVVFDVVELRAEIGRRDAERVRYVVADVAEALPRPRSAERQVRQPHRPQRLAGEVRGALARDRDVVDLRCVHAVRLEAPPDGMAGEAGGVLDPGEALLLHRRQQLAVPEERRRRVAVIGVDAQDYHRR